MSQTKKKIWFFKYETWQFSMVYLPLLWYAFKRYYELNGKHSDQWEWVEPIVDFQNWNVDTIVENDPAAAAEHLRKHPLFNENHIDNIIEKFNCLDIKNNINVQASFMLYDNKINNKC